jgi:KaiC/GvpD/RAD55 family RecA-like ATPase
MSDRSDTASTGDETLDGMLAGGLPRGRAVLVTGGPGTGKSTLAMQFLQSGLDAGEDCLYVSTEQTANEIEEAFAGYDFETDHEDLDFVTVHPAPGQTIEHEGQVVTLDTLGADEGADDDPLFEESFQMPLTAESVKDHLRPYGPRDRVVFDSVSGLSAIAEDDSVFRRTVLDLIRFFSDEYGATTVFSAEDRDDGNHPLRFTTHGVIELERRRIEDDVHRFVTVTKMRGVDHDRRTAELEFVPSGVRVGPSRRSQPPVLKDHRHRAVGIDGLDNLTGGGLVRGVGVLFLHDGRANLSALYGQLLASSLDGGDAVTLVPTIDLRQGRVESLLSGHGYDLGELLADGRLSVVDLVGAWDPDEPNVHGGADSAADLMDVLAGVDERTDRRQFQLVSADAVVHSLGPTEAREARYAQETQVLDGGETLLHVMNEDVVGDEIGAFYGTAAEQVLETWIADDGLQYLTLRKSPCGFVGSTSLVEYVEEPPYLRVQNPPQVRENPYTEHE